MKPFLKLLTLVLCFAPATAWADDATTTLPKVDDVLARNIKALGGEKALRAHTHRTVHATFEMKEMGLKADMTVHQAAPNLMLQEITIEGLGQERAGHDGNTAWQLSMMAGPSVLDGAAKRQFLRDADFYLDLNLRGWYDTLEVKGIESWGGEDCVAIVASQGEGAPDTWYYSVASGLGRGFAGTASTEMGEINTEMVVSDYREMDGIQVPTVLTSKLMGQTQVITVTDLSHARFDHAVFAVPDEIAVIVGE